MELSLSEKLNQAFLSQEEDRRQPYLLDGYRCRINEKMVVQFTEHKRKIFGLEDVKAALQPNWNKYIEILNKYKDVIDI